MKRKFEKLFQDYEKLIGKVEKNILVDFKEVLAAAYILLGEQFRKYEKDGNLSYEEMAKYKRLEKFYHELDLIVSEGYKKSYKSINKGLKDIYLTSYNGTKDIVEFTIGRNLIPIVKEEVILRAINNDISGLKWTDRMGIHRDTAVLKIRETVAQGLHQGETYSTMSKRLNDTLSKQVIRPLGIVRTEGHRVLSEARKDSLDKVKNKLKMTKTWITARDERVRGQKPTDTMDHISMDGKTIPYDEDFILPDGSSGFAPGQIGNSNDINCRCDWIIDFLENNNGKSSMNEGIIDLSKHSEKRLKERDLTQDSIRDTLESPLKVGDIIVDDLGRPSQKLIGEASTVVINSDTKEVITVWKTSSKLVKKLKDGEKK